MTIADEIEFNKRNKYPAIYKSVNFNSSNNKYWDSLTKNEKIEVGAACVCCGYITAEYPWSLDNWNTLKLNQKKKIEDIVHDFIYGLNFMNIIHKNIENF